MDFSARCCSPSWFGTTGITIVGKYVFVALFVSCVLHVVHSNTIGAYRRVPWASRSFLTLSPAYLRKRVFRACGVHCKKVEFERMDNESMEKDTGRARLDILHVAAKKYNTASYKLTRAAHTYTVKIPISDFLSNFKSARVEMGFRFIALTLGSFLERP